MKKLLIVLLLSFPLFGDVLNLKEGFVGAHTEMIMDSTIDPLNTHLKADISIDGDDLLTLKGKFFISMDLFRSDNDDRDEHMNEANEVSSFAQATYTVSSLTKSEKENMYVIHGTLSYHGVSKAFMADAEILNTDGAITINATSSLLMSDYGVEPPCMVFMCVRDQVDIFVKAVLIR